MRLLVLLGLAACARGVVEAPEHEPWVPRFDPPGLEHGFFARHPALTDLSTWGTAVSGPVGDRPDQAWRGALGVGNGRVFSLLGLTDPLATLHGLVGPVYRTEPRFFGDVTFALEVDGVEVGTEAEWAARPRRTSLVVTRADGDGLSFYTVDVAPMPANVPPDAVPPVIVRFLLVRNAGEARRVGIGIAPRDPVTIDGDTAVTSIGEGARWLGLRPVGARWDADGGALDLGLVGAGGEASAAVLVATATSADGLRAELAALAAVDLEALLDETVDAWHAWSDGGTRLEVDDPVLVDFLEGLDAAVRVQQSAGGGIAPMSRYTGTWLRDTIGPVRLYTRTGRFDEARAALEYLELCHRARGDYGNSCASGLVPADVALEPDWDALPAFSGRTAAEGPSYVALGWTELARWTGDTASLGARWPYLRRSLLAQQITADGLQSWSGDETFRLAMNVALGFPLEHPWQDLAWSSNSGLLMVAAARRLAEVADAIGEEVDAEALRARAAAAEAGLDRFRRPEGHLAALILRDEAAPPVDLPFEDAALHGLWAGAWEPGDPRAREEIEGLRVFAGRGGGVFQSPPAPLYADAADVFGVSGGVATGMLPGYALFDLVTLGDPEHPGAFDALADYASTSGESVEGLIFETHAAFQPFYDAGGGLSDVAARFRPWEGGIVADAAWTALVGAEPLGPATLRLRPRAPNGAPAWSVGPVRGPGVEVRVRGRWDPRAGHVLTIENLGGPATVVVEVPLAVWDDAPDWRAEGPVEATLVSLPAGEAVVRFAPIALSDGETVEVSAGVVAPGR